MACRTETVGALQYEYCPDQLPPRADRLQALMRGRFVDELTGNGINAQLTVHTTVVGVTPRTAFNGIAGLIGNPARRFPGLAANTVTLDMNVSCRRFVTQSFSADLGPINTAAGYPADFPDFFAPIDLGDVGLHREATVISGRCVQSNGLSRTPLSNTTIDISGLWHRFPAANVDPLAVVEAPNIVSLLQGLYEGRRAATDQVRQRTLQPRAGEEKRLLSVANAGDRQVRLSDRVNLVAGQVLALQPEHNELVEYLPVTAVNGATGDTQPATVTLAYPLKKSHREGVTAVRVDPQPPGASNDFTRDAIIGDQTLFLAALTDINDSTVEISGGGSVEYHRSRLYRAVSDADGFFSLPPIARVAMMQLHASHAALADVNRIFSPDYERAENRGDLVFI